MEKTNVPYDAWPEWMKLLTAFRLKSLTIREPGPIVGLSAVNIIIGIVLFIQVYPEKSSGATVNESADFWSMYLALLNIIIGIFNLFVTKNAITWIRDNSSWEERDKHTSKGKYKLQYILIMLSIFMLPWLITCLICC